MKSILINIIILLTATNLYSANQVMTADIDEGIGSFTSEYISTLVSEAEDGEYEALLITLDTPGGARAGSAGVFITLSGNIAAMAPGTNIGAAHPVGMGGESGDSAEVMTQKVTNDAAALIRSIAKKRNKNVDMAELTVRNSSSYSETEALDSNLIDVIAKNKQELLKLVHGKVVSTASGDVKLDTKNAELVKRKKDWKEGLLSFLSDPNIAYIFILLAMYGIMIEFYNPGSIFPGVIGVISAIIAGFSLQMLPVNYAGLTLMVVSIVLFIMEVKIVSFGLLSLGGVVTFLLGSIMLIDSPGDFMSIGLGIIIPATAVTAAVFIGIVYLAVKSQNKKVSSGVSTLVGKEVVVFSDILPPQMGRVKVTGEIWRAEADESLLKGEFASITAVDGLTLTVKKVNKS